MSRDRLETETSRPRLHPWNSAHLHKLILFEATFIQLFMWIKLHFIAAPKRKTSQVSVGFRVSFSFCDRTGKYFPTWSVIMSSVRRVGTTFHYTVSYCRFTAVLLPGQFAPRSESANRTLANSLPGTFALGPFRSLALSFR